MNNWSFIYIIFHFSMDNIIVLKRMTALEMEASKKCVFDSLTIYDGPRSDSPVLLGPLCNQSEVDLK